MKCSLKVCQKEGADWSPVLQVYAEGSDVGIDIQLGLHICDEHKRTSTLADFLTDDGWASIVHAIESQGREAPARSLTRLGWARWQGSMLQKHNQAATS